MIQTNYIVAIWSDDTFNPYYLIKSITEPTEITDKLCDDYGHTFPVGPGSYLEQSTCGKWVGSQNQKHPNRDM